MKFIGIVLFAIGAAILYGIVHDQITTRICIEYFTMAHPRLILSDSPTVLGLFWGVVATWWVGLGLGVPLALASRVGRYPKLDWSHHRQGIVRLLFIMAVLAVVAGLGVWLDTRTNDPFYLADLTGERISPHLRSRFLAVWAAHLTSYGVGFLGGIALIVLTIVRRRRMMAESH
jgi:H+/Cl- antiporter ClcA